jgi:hypothetical protein
MGASARPSSDAYVVDEPLLRTIALEIKAAIPRAEVHLSTRQDSPCHLIRSRTWPR